MHKAALFLAQFAQVLSELSINKDSDRLVHIRTRKGGFFGWLFTLLKINSTSELNIYKDKIEYIRVSLSGTIKTVLPISNISIVEAGYYRPFLLLVIGVISFIYWFWLLIFPCLLSIPLFYIPYYYDDYYLSLNLIPSWVVFLITGLCLFTYNLNKSMLISATSTAVKSVNIAFKEGLIDRVKFSEEQAKNIEEILNNLLLHKSADCDAVIDKRELDSVNTRNTFNTIVFIIVVSLMFILNIVRTFSIFFGL